MNHMKHIFICVIALFALSQYATIAHAQSGNIDWGGWTLEYTTGAQNDGIAINKVRYQGKEIMSKGNFPAMPVYYQNNACGPYLDRLDTDLATVPWANNAKLVRREFTVNGVRWYELGNRQFIGNYDIYQVWYFNSEGIIDAHLFSRGLQCNVFHEHWPHWRFDFDIAGPGNDQILRRTSNGLEAYTSEFNVKATAARNHDWIVQDTVTQDYVEIQFDSGEWNVAGTIVPETVYGKNRVIGRRYNSNQDSWHTSGHASLPANWNDGANRVGYGNGESINNTDLVLWYSGYLPHSSNDGARLWHSTGVRIVVKDASSSPPPAPPPGQSSCTTYRSSDTPIAMPNGVANINSTINVPNVGSIEDVNVSVDMPHEWAGDLRFKVAHAGRNVTIIDRPGIPASNFGCDKPNIIATLDDSAGTSVESVCNNSAPAINGTFRPNNALSAFNGANGGGDWTLTVEDAYTSRDLGSLNGWSVEVCSAGSSPPPTEPAVLWRETFAGLNNGARQDNGATAWSATGTQNYGVTNGRFGVNGNTNGEVRWRSESISISGYDSVSLSADIRSAGGLDPSGVYQDYLRVYYKIDGGAQVLVADKLGSFNNTTVSLSNLRGSTIQIIVRAKTTGGDELYQWDNITVSGS